MYDQTKQPETKYSCVPYGFFNLLYYMFGIKISSAWILKFISIMKVAGVLLTWGAVTGPLYAWCVWRINQRTGLNIIVQKASITRGNLNPDLWYGIGFKKLSTFLIAVTNDGDLSRHDIEEILKRPGYGHHGIYNPKTEVFRDPYGDRDYTIRMSTLQWGVDKGLFYDPARTLVPGDEKTKKVLNYVKAMRKEKHDWDYSKHEAQEQKYIDIAAGIYTNKFFKLT